MKDTSQDLLENGHVCAQCGELTLDIYPAWHCGCDGFCEQCAADHHWQECLEERAYWAVMGDPRREP